MPMATSSPRGITLGQFTTVFVPTGLLLVFALITPELGGDLNVGRTRLTMWPAILLLMPALGLYLFWDRSQTVANLAHLFWTAALAAFVVHVYWGGFVFYHGIADVFHNQGPALAGVNFTLLGLWVLDAMVLWFAPEHRYGTILHNGVRIFAFVFFTLDLLIGRSGAAHALGFFFVGVLLAAGLVRLATTRVHLTA
jgi:hypothetical protein